jgi:steroid delta-isomerase-like uncharacterized protein
MTGWPYTHEEMLRLNAAALPWDEIHRLAPNCETPAQEDALAEQIVREPVDLPKGGATVDEPHQKGSRAMAVTEKALSPSQVVQTAFERLNAHDADGLVECDVEDVVEDWAVVGRLEGRTAVRDYFASVFAAVPDIHVDIERMVAEDEAVFVHWRLTGRFTGASYNGIAATGRPVDIRGNDYFTVRDGKIVAAFIAYDGMEYAIQAGVLPAGGTAADRIMKAGVNAVTAVRRQLRR